MSSGLTDDYIAELEAEIERLRELLRDVLPVLEFVGGEVPEEKLQPIEARIRAALK
jgi:hypothetical protein